MKSANGHAFARAGQSVKLTCVAGGGQPEPDLVLLKNGARVAGVEARKKENSFIFVVGKEDNGAVWQCSAENPLATVASKEITLNVLCEYTFDRCDLRPVL